MSAAERCDAIVIGAGQDGSARAGGERKRAIVKSFQAESLRRIEATGGLDLIYRVARMPMKGAK
jgi:hypothetical protein